MARAQLTGPTPRGHDGGAAEYHVAGPSRVYKHGDLGERITFYGPLRNALGREGSDPNHRLFHKEIEIQLDAARADLSAAIEEVWPDDVGPELDLVARLSRTSRASRGAARRPRNRRSPPSASTTTLTTPSTI